MALFAFQGAVISSQILAIAHVRRSAEVLPVAVLVLSMKVVAIPHSLLRIFKEVKSGHEELSSTTPAQPVFITVRLILISFFAVPPYACILRVDKNTLAASIALVLTSTFLMVSRKKAPRQVVGLLVLENDTFLAALTPKRLDRLFSSGNERQYRIRRGRQPTLPLTTRRRYGDS
jgi:hydrogenase-4 membrane subunit HyfE